MRDDMVPGAAFPDFELPDHTDTPRRLSLLQGDDPMVLTLNRGLYCPKDRQQLQALVPFHAQMRVGFARLVSVTNDSLVGVNDLRLGVGADWPFSTTPSARSSVTWRSRSTRIPRTTR